MPKSTSLNFTQNLKVSTNTFLAADSTNLKVIYTAGVNDSVVKSIMINSDDTVTKLVDLYANTGTADIVLGGVLVAANSGTNGIAATVDLLNSSMFPGLPIDATGKRVLPLQANTVLKANLSSAMSAGKVLTVVTLAEDY